MSDLDDTPILALDTSTDACSVAVAWRGTVHRALEVIPRGHAGRILDMAATVLGRHGLRPGDAGLVAWCCGPGAFTGVRIAASAVQGIAWGAGAPVVGVSTLAVLAQGAFRRDAATRVASALDARMGQVYWGGYERDAGTGLMVSVLADRVGAPGAMPAFAGALGAGSGWETYPEALAAACGAPVTVDPGAVPDAQDLIPFARRALADGTTVAAAEAVPVYLRDRVTA